MQIEDKRRRGGVVSHTVTVKTLERQNRRFAGTGGVSACNRPRGFVPGFLDRATGLVYASRTADGCPSPIHLLDGLPDSLIVSRTVSGQVSAVKGTVIPGFILDGEFYTREQVAHVLE